MMQILLLPFYPSFFRYYGIVLRALPEALRDFSDYRMLAYSVLLIAIMLLNENKRFKAWKSRFSLSGWFRGLRRGKAGGKEADAS